MSLKPSICDGSRKILATVLETAISLTLIIFLFLNIIKRDLLETVFAIFAVGNNITDSIYPQVIPSVQVILFKKN